MYTQCPQCDTLFRIGAAQLAQAHGLVCCGVCGHRFNALDALSERPEPQRRREPAPADTAPPADNAAPALPLAAEIDEALAARAEAAAERLVEPGAAAALPVAAETIVVGERADLPPLTIAAHELGPPWITAEGGPAAARREPSLGPASAEPELEPIAAGARAPTVPPPAAPAARRPSGLATAGWAVANVVLVVLLLAQYAYFERDRLAQYPELRPALTQLCALAGCELPLQKDASRIGLVNRVVQSHPQHDDALLIDATLVNDAPYTQPYPLIELRFSDLNNRLVAGRRFRPAEYLAAGTPIDRGMPPKTPVRFSLEIVDPGKEAVGFQFSLQ